MVGKLASQVRGLSEAQFLEAYGSEAQCRAVVEKLRWPKGFVCALCGGCEGTRLSTRPKIQCRACRHQVSLTAGTIFHSTKLPLTSWFLARSEEHTSELQSRQYLVCSLLLEKTTEHTTSVHGPVSGD